MWVLLFSKAKKNMPLFFGIMGAVFIGFLEGAGVENAITEQIFKSIKNGDVVGFMAYLLIFTLIWIQVRGLKIAVENLNKTIASSFAQGEIRFTDIEHRLTVLEQKKL